MDKNFPNSKYELVFIKNITGGQVETVLHAKHLIRPENSIIIYNIDTHFISTRLKSKILTMKNRDIDGLLGCYQSNDENLSFVKLNEKGFVEQVKEKETQNLANLEKNIKGEIYGQDEPVKDIVDKILVAQAGLKEENKPIGSFVFMGPTGIGKTETARQLAFQLGVKLVRFDMSEFQEKHSVAKLIGSPPGYVGFEENAGQLITALQEAPNCVLLLDEIDKSRPDVSSLLLLI